MMTMTRFATLGILAALVSGCVETETATQLPSQAMPSAAEQACLIAVTRETNNPDIVLLGSEFSQAGTVVRVGVGADQAPWKCIAYADGSTGGIEYMGING